MKLVADNPNAPGQKDMESKVKEFKHGTPIEKVEKTFVRRMRKRLLNVKSAMNVALKRPGELVTHMNETDLWYLLREQGMMCTQKDLHEIMEHFDQNRDGKIHFEEFAHELLGLPRPAAVRHVQPFYAKRKPLSEQAQQLIHKLAVKCERAAAAPSRLHGMFKGFDKDGSGSIAYDEFECMVKEFSCEMEGSDAAASLLTRFDKDGQGELSYIEFITDVLGLQANALEQEGANEDGEARCSTPVLMQSVSNSLKQKIFANKAAIAKAFAAFDADGGGSLSYAEFRDGLKALGLPITTKQAKQLFREFDKQRKGELETQTFAADVLGVAGSQANSVRAASRARSVVSSRSMPAGYASIVPTPRVANPLAPTPGASNQLRKASRGSQGGGPRMPAEFMPGHVTSRSRSALDGRMSRRPSHLDPIASHRSYAPQITDRKYALDSHRSGGRMTQRTH